MRIKIRTLRKSAPGGAAGRQRKPAALAVTWRGLCGSFFRKRRSRDPSVAVKRQCVRVQHHRRRARGNRATRLRARDNELCEKPCLDSGNRAVFARHAAGHGRMRLNRSALPRLEFRVYAVKGIPRHKDRVNAELQAFFTQSHWTRVPAHPPLPCRRREWRSCRDRCPRRRGSAVVRHR